jgi:hypothetical protein
VQIGTIVKSTSHVDYVCQVFGPADAVSPPTPEDYAFGTFVRIGMKARSGHMVGLIRDTILMNPEFGQLGPRLSPPADLEIFSPDYLSERAVLVSVVAVGQVTGDGRVRQGIPLPAAALGARVEKMSDDGVRNFHLAASGLQIAYAPCLLAREDPLMPHLLLRVIDRLSGLFPDQARQLAVLRGNLAWKMAVMPME